jgi:hypothetical protein
MRIQMTVTCGWETMWEKMVSEDPMMDGVIDRTEERGDLPDFDSPDPQEREDAEWIDEMSTGRGWARRMDEWTKRSIVQAQLVGRLLSYEAKSSLDYPEPTEDDLEPDELIAPHALDPEMDEKVQIENFEALLDRMDSRGGIEPDPTSDDEQEREDALWLAKMRVARAIYEKDRCESSKAKVDMMSRSKPSS